MDSAFFRGHEPIVELGSFGIRCESESALVLCCKNPATLLLSTGTSDYEGSSINVRFSASTDLMNSDAS